MLPIPNTQQYGLENFTSKLDRNGVPSCKAGNMKCYNGLGSLTLRLSGNKLF